MAKVLVAKVCGLCAGSLYAINQTRNAVENNKKVVLFKEILHNKNVISSLESKGAKVKNSLAEMNSDDFVIVRAHGEPKSTFQTLKERGIPFLDCTCGNVRAINFLVDQKDSAGYKIILIGKHGLNGQPMHPEVAGTSGWCTNPIIIESENEIDQIDMSYDKYFLVVQTTFSRLLAEKIIRLVATKMHQNNKVFEYKNTICDAQKNINLASIELAQKVDIMIVIGGKNSSNTKELYNALKEIKPAFHIEDEIELAKIISSGTIKSNQTIGLTAGASTMPEDILRRYSQLCGGYIN